MLPSPSASSPAADVTSASGSFSERAGRRVGWRRSSWLLVWVLAAMSAGTSIAVSRVLFPLLSINNDEPLYRLQAQTIAGGHLFPAAPAPASSYVPWLAAVDHGHYVLKYTPIVPAWHALSWVLTGGFDLSLACIAAATVVMTFLLAREVLGDTRSALVAAALAAVSPLVVVQSGLLLPYLPTLLLLETFAFLVVRGVRGPHRWLLAWAGLSAGVAFTIRPYDAVLFVVPVLVWAAFGPARGRRWSTAWPLILGAVPALAFLIAFDVMATGHPFRLPFNALESGDSLGFGVRRLYPSDHGHHFGFVQGLAGVGDHLYLLGVWISGGVLLLLLGGWAGLRRRLPAAAVALAASGALLTVGYVAFWGAWNAADIWGGIRYVGPFYLLPLLVPVVLCGARGLVDLWDRRAAFGAVAMAICLALSGLVLTSAIHGNAKFTAQDRQLSSLLERPGRQVVFVANDPPFLMHPSAVLSNPPLNRLDRSTDPPRVYAITRGAADFQVLDEHPGATAWLLDISSGLGKHLHVGESARLTALRDVRGEQVVLRLQVHVPERSAGKHRSAAKATPPGTGAAHRTPPELRLQVTSGRVRTTYLLSGRGDVRLTVRPDGVQLAGAVPIEVKRLRRPASMLQIALIQRVGGKSSVLGQTEVAVDRQAGMVRMLVPGRDAGTVGSPGPTSLRVSLASVTPAS